MAALIPSASATGSGTMTLAGPSTNSNQTITIPDATGTMMVSGNMPAFSVWMNNGNNNYSVTSGTETVVPLDTEIYDTANAFDTSTYRFTPQVAGYYQINAMIRINGTAITAVYGFIYKNGSGFFRFTQTSSTISPCHYTGSCIVYLNGSTDYITLIGRIDATSPSFGTNGATSSCSLSGALIRT
jgi:hypothetical protein